VRRNRDTVVDLTPAGVVVGSTRDTTADKDLSFFAEARLLDRKFHALGWSRARTPPSRKRTRRLTT